MQPEPRAVVFDLDDTLYPYRAFVASGFQIVARQIADEFDLSPSLVLRTLRRASLTGRRGDELQALCEACVLPAGIVPRLVAAIREHAPVLRLPTESRDVLAVLRRGWRVGILTNGQPEIQRRKIAALGVEELVDTVVLATECGDGRGKPSAAAFEAVLERLGAAPGASVFVGDDPDADMAGAAAVGMHTIHFIGHRRAGAICATERCRVHVDRLGQVPATAAWLVPERMERHVG